MGNHLNAINRDRAKAAVIVLLAIAVNVLLNYIVGRLGLPIYLDTVGTIFISVMMGAVPGIVTAIASNTLCSIFNEYALYYSIISISIVLVTSYFVKTELFKKKSNAAVYLIIISALGGIPGIIFQWIILGGPQFEDVEQAARMLSEGAGMDFFMSALLINFGFNIVDKGFSAFMAYMGLVYIPKDVKDRMWNLGWKQKPITEAEIKEYKKESYAAGKSLNARMTIMLIVASASMAGLMAFCGIKLYFRDLKKEYAQDAIKASEFVAENIDGDLIKGFLSDGEYISEYENQKYMDINNLLVSYHESLSDIRYLYVYQIRPDGCRLVFDTDPEVRNTEKIGTMIPFDETFEPYIPALLNGEKIEVVEVHSRYGYFMTAYTPIYDSKGHCVAYAGADASLEYMTNYIKDFVLQVLLVFFGFLILIIAVGLWFTAYGLVYPVKSMARFTGRFMKRQVSQDELDESVKQIRSLNIKTGDEIEALYQSICRMASGMAEQMRNIRYYTESVSTMQNGLIITLADIVENRDSDTGAHVQKTAAYVRIVLEGLRRKGYYLEKITDEYIEDVVRSAPLHDVGKVSIPDAVLNKPGKLTPEEFEIMKTHTTAGKKIMENAIAMVQGGTYLKEARNMAGYHHERWDGKGYPEGLHGEVIPLSARVMAVADVFDALTSPRVYKPAFSLEKSLEIISEGAGTQFDPKCVEVFMDSLDDARMIWEKYHES